MAGLLACLAMLTHPGPVRAADELVLGQVLPLSGPLAGFGREVRNGTQWCVNAINQRGGVAGRALRLVTRDDGSDPQRALQEAKALVAEGGASVLLGPWGGAAAATVLPWAAQAGVAVLGPHSGEVASRQREWHTAFFLTANHSLEGEKLAEHLHALGVRSVALVRETAGPGASAGIAMEEALSVAGIQVLGSLEVGPGQSASAAVQALARLQPQAVVLATSGAASVEVLKVLAQQRQATGFLLGVYGLSFTVSPEDLRALGPAARGLVLSRVLPSVGDERQRLPAFYQAARRAAGQTEASPQSLEGCLAPLVLAEALRANPPASAKPAAVLKSLRDTSGVALGELAIPLGPSRTREAQFVDIVMIDANGRALR